MGRDHETHAHKNAFHTVLDSTGRLWQKVYVAAILIDNLIKKKGTQNLSEQIGFRGRDTTAYDKHIMLLCYINTYSLYSRSVEIT